MKQLKPINIAYAVGKTHAEFEQLDARGKWYYFFLVHFGPDCDEIKYLFKDMK